MASPYTLKLDGQQPQQNAGGSLYNPNVFGGLNVGTGTPTGGGANWMDARNKYAQQIAAGRKKTNDFSAFNTAKNDVTAARNKVAPPNPYGSQSGPGILEQWFNERANGTDPAFEYGLKRGMNTLDNRYSAMGSFNSGANAQAGSDLYANLLSQRMGQLDSLAGGASGEHQGRLNAMFGQGLGIANGAAGTSSAYDLGAAGNMGAAAQAQQGMALNKAGVEGQAFNNFLNNGLSAYALYQRGAGGGAPGGGSNLYNPLSNPNGLMAPSF